MISRFELALACLALALAPIASHASSTTRTEFDLAVRATPDLRQGAQLFETCAACHGPRGEGIDDGSIPAIAGQHSRVTVKQLVDFRSDRRWDIRMEHFTDRHHLKGPQDIADVAGYIASLPRPRPVGIGPGSTLGQGASVYFRLCESCHGPVGEGSADRTIPRVGGQHFEYLVRQFHDAAEGRRPNMEGDHARLLGTLDRDAITGIADYLSRMSPARREPPQ